MSRRAGGLLVGRPRTRLLGEVGVLPDQIGKILLTHMNFDHANNVSAFQQANVCAQSDEYEAAGGCRCPTSPPRAG